MPRRWSGTTDTPWVTGLSAGLFLVSIAIIKGANVFGQQVAEMIPTAYNRSCHNDPDTFPTATLSASPGAVPQPDHVFLSTTTVSTPLNMTHSASPLPTRQGHRAAKSTPAENSVNWIDHLSAIAVDSDIEEYVTLIGNILHHLQPRYGRFFVFASVSILSITAQRIVLSLHHLIRSAMDEIADRFAAAPADVKEDVRLALGLLLAFFYARPEVERNLTDLAIHDGWAQMMAGQVREVLRSCTGVCGFPCLAFGGTALLLIR
ncbi:uncharacterized protein K452DRAFT_300126 [Aplosporella prunicola CBS 121167]|uniref:Uncharacterized protein n=1 Tax=Aplosporella prunicola CBS 121167 TaxID=1176127 RepID=A0A6A6B6C7_9PEZI|nr:uncharacterized protein K452DRAFT_300126 [Aplosporella prunicola CBS 121167]KAF2139570.1 hypothetical protein K452DRAFT_300126 [Aplosporella prunicola CBS 121167]